MRRRRRSQSVSTSSTGDAFTHGDAVDLRCVPWWRGLGIEPDSSYKARPMLVLLQAEPIDPIAPLEEPDSQPSCFEIRIFLRPERRRRRGWKIEDGILNREQVPMGYSQDRVPGGGHSGFPESPYDPYTLPQYLRPAGYAASAPEGPSEAYAFSPFSTRSAPPVRLGRRRHSALKPGRMAPAKQRDTWAFKGSKKSSAAASAGTHRRAAPRVPKAHTYTHAPSALRRSLPKDSTWRTPRVPWITETELRAYSPTPSLNKRGLSVPIESPVSDRGLGQAVIQRSRTLDGDGRGGGPRGDPGARAGEEGDGAGARGDARGEGAIVGYAVGRRQRKPGAHQIQPLWEPPAASSCVKTFPVPSLGPTHSQERRAPALSHAGSSPVREGAGEWAGDRAGEGAGEWLHAAPSMRTLAAEGVLTPLGAVSRTVSDAGPRPSSSPAPAPAPAGAGAGEREREKGGAWEEERLLGRRGANDNGILTLGPSAPAPSTGTLEPARAGALKGGAASAEAHAGGGGGKGLAVDSLVGNMLVREREAQAKPLPKAHTTAADAMVGMFGSSAPPVTSRKPRVTSRKPQAASRGPQAKIEDKGQWWRSRSRSRSPSAQSLSMAALLQERLARVEENDRRLGIRTSEDSPEPLGQANSRDSAQLPKLEDEGVAANAGSVLAPSSLAHSGEVPATPSVAGSRAGPYVSLHACTTADKVMSWQDAFVPGPGWVGNSPIFAPGRGGAGPNPTSVAGHGGYTPSSPPLEPKIQPTGSPALGAHTGAAGMPRGAGELDGGSQTSGTPVHRGKLSNGNLDLDTWAKPMGVPSPTSGTGGARAAIAGAGASVEVARGAAAAGALPASVLATSRRGGVGVVPVFGEWKMRKGGDLVRTFSSRFEGLREQRQKAGQGVPARGA